MHKQDEKCLYKRSENFSIIAGKIKDSSNLVTSDFIRMKLENVSVNREKLAEKLDVSAKFCSDIELGMKGMSPLMKLSDLLFLSTDYILFGTESDETTPKQQQIAHIVRECPEAFQEELLTIVSTFVSAVSK